VIVIEIDGIKFVAGNYDKGARMVDVNCSNADMTLTMCNIKNAPEGFIVESFLELDEKNKKILVKWLGFKEPSWEPYENMKNDLSSTLFAELLADLAYLSS
jgi:hypothetical protein